MALDHATRLNGATKESSAGEFTRYAQHATRARSFPTISGLPARGGARQTAAITIPTLQVVPAEAAAPYAQTAVVIPEHRAWRQRVALIWVRWRLGLGSALAIVAALLLIETPQSTIGLILLTLALGTIALEAIAARCLDSRLIGAAATLTLVADLALLGAGMLLIGPRGSLLLLLPGSLLATALLAETSMAIAGGALAFLGYGGVLLAQMTGSLSPLATLDARTLAWIDALAALMGLTLALVAVVLAVGQLRRAQGNEAAATHRLSVNERRTHARQIALDADAIALQTALAETLRGGEPHVVTTCEELEPLANMINATTARLPGLLRDREDRIAVEKAVRDLAAVLETAWAGFAFTWPAASNTVVDRLVNVLRPQSSPLGGVRQNFAGKREP
jgi:hypothetical protein